MVDKNFNFITSILYYFIFICLKLCVVDFDTKHDQTKASRNAKPRHNPRGGFATRRKAKETGYRVTSGICNQHSHGSSDVTSGHLPNKQKLRNQTLSTGNDFEKGAVNGEHVSCKTNTEIWFKFCDLIKISNLFYIFNRYIFTYILHIEININ